MPAEGWSDEYKTSKIVFRRIDPGKFVMGSPVGELCRDHDERQHEVVLTEGYYMSLFETTQRQWELVTGTRPSLHTAAYAQRPVEHVSWEDVRGPSFLGRLRDRTGLATLDLPTEAQWEYACRAGETNSFPNGKALTVSGNDPAMTKIGRYWFTGGHRWKDGKTDDTAVGGTAIVGSYLPNAWGLYDMVGNVLEWTLDRYGPYPEGTVWDPEGPATGGKRVMRGGGLFDNAYSCRSAARHGIAADARTCGYGFRLAIGRRVSRPLADMGETALSVEVPACTGLNGTYPVPRELLSRMWRVRVGDAECGVGRVNTFEPLPFRAYPQDFGGEYGFTQFEMTNTVLLRASTLVPRALAGATVVPACAPASCRAVSEDELEIEVRSPCKFAVVFPDRRHPLLVFAYPPESNRPDEKDPKVKVFEPGITVIPGKGELRLSSGETLYLKPGAFVRGSVYASGENIRICGRGFIDDTPVEWCCRRTPCAIGVKNARNVVIEDVGVCGAAGWTISTKNAENVVIRDVKLCCGKLQNDDGIDPCNTRHLLVERCFIRTDDDCIAVKGSKFEYGDCQDIVVRGCVLWADRARCVLLGHESRAKFMRDILIEDCDLIHYSNAPAFLFEPGEGMRLTNVVVRNVRIRNDIPGRRTTVVAVRPTANYAMANKVPGHVCGVRFENVSLSGEPCSPEFAISGYDDRHRVEGCSLENVRVFGRVLSPDSPEIKVGKWVSDLRVAAEAAR